MNKEIYLAGYISRCGGADLEAAHNIALWLKYGVEVHCVPMFGCDPICRSIMDASGVITHEYKPNIFKDKIVVSWCNGEFLRLLPEIMEQGKPRCVAFWNCMTWKFDAEITAHKNKWIDYFGFVSQYQKKMLAPEYEKIGPFRELEGYRPYFDVNNPVQQIEFKYNPPDKSFNMGRVSRDDMHKYAADTWNIFYKVSSPIPTKTFMLGFADNAFKKCGKAPAGLDWQTWTPNSVPIKDIFHRLHVMIHKTGGSRESYSRSTVEAMAFGVVPIVENDYAFSEFIENGVHGYLCNSSDEMSFRASELAFDEQKRKKMVFAAREHLVNEIAHDEKCWEPWRKLFQEMGMS